MKLFGDSYVISNSIWCGCLILIFIQSSVDNKLINDQFVILRVFIWNAVIMCDHLISFRCENCLFELIFQKSSILCWHNRPEPNYKYNVILIATIYWCLGLRKQKGYTSTSAKCISNQFTSVTIDLWDVLHCALTRSLLIHHSCCCSIILWSQISNKSYRLHIPDIYFSNFVACIIIQYPTILVKIILLSLKFINMLCEL